MVLAVDVSRIAAFVTLGTLTTTQQLAGAVLATTDGADASLVAEESLALVSVSTARSVEAALQSRPDAAEGLFQTIIQLPFLYHDYLLADAVIEAGSSAPKVDPDEIFSRMERKREFYLLHFGKGFPGERLLRDKMELWMGRVSPPRTGTHPADRLDQIDGIRHLINHNKVVFAFCRREVNKNATAQDGRAEGATKE